MIYKTDLDIPKLCMRTKDGLYPSFVRMYTSSEYLGQFLYQGHRVKVKLTGVRGWSSFD